MIVVIIQGVAGNRILQVKPFVLVLRATGSI